MVNYREILRLDSQGYTQHQIAASLHSSRNTIREVIQLANTAGLKWPLDDSLTNEKILLMLYPDRQSNGRTRKEPDYSYIHKELAKPGVNLSLLWSEYSAACYVEACDDMKGDNWLKCHIHAYAYYGGVTRLLIPDNLKTGVTHNTKFETKLNRSYQELAEHYDTAIVPARVLHPKDKSLAEGTVKFVTTWIIAALRNRRFFSLEEVRTAVAEKLEELNDIPFKKREGSRRTVCLLFSWLRQRA